MEERINKSFLQFRAFREKVLVSIEMKYVQKVLYSTYVVSCYTEMGMTSWPYSICVGRSIFPCPPVHLRHEVQGRIRIFYANWAPLHAGFTEIMKKNFGNSYLEYMYTQDFFFNPLVLVYSAEDALVETRVQKRKKMSLDLKWAKRRLHI